ncbi:cell division cycle 25 homolog d [Brienomyrus brachyistius]|uniref:cell division cycle 25 homolog d n=1 Tax=Brienomyrus brachyistius TaxID=42636 RepID=UPI0020B3F106|nr:cell division cycle 25 homolog d [Brienomyrus brachyistius]
MEAGWNGERCGEDGASPQWISPPDSFSSPVAELSCNLRKLHCHDSATPRRKLQLTPELKTPSPLSSRSVSQEIKTPAVTKRKAERFKSSCTLSKMRRLRVKLSSRFVGKEPERELVHLEEQQGETSQREDVGRLGDEDTRDAVEPCHRLRKTRCRLRRPLLDIPLSVLEDRNLIGDFSKPHLLVAGGADHRDLRGISAQTMASLLLGQYSGVVESCLIIDCRYPYEYLGGHIMGAVNLHSEDQLQEALFLNPAPFLGRQDCCHTSCVVSATPPITWSPGTREGQSEKALQDLPLDGAQSSDASSPRKLVVFHCEFSSQRGPRLCRYLRKLDRCLNVYPELLYPELYILEGGYKDFHSHFPGLCNPPGYVPMRHRDFKDQLRRFQKKRRTKTVLGQEALMSVHTR